MDSNSQQYKNSKNNKNYVSPLILTSHVPPCMHMVQLYTTNDLQYVTRLYIYIFQRNSRLFYIIPRNAT